jgi:hypothetical protein
VCAAKDGDEADVAGGKKDIQVGGKHEIGTTIDKDTHGSKTMSVNKRSHKTQTAGEMAVNVNASGIRIRAIFLSTIVNAVDMLHFCSLGSGLFLCSLCSFFF